MHHRRRARRAAGDAESPRIGKAVQDVSVAAVAPGCRARVALVQIESGLVAFADVHQEPQSVFRNLHQLRRLFAGHRPGRRLKVLPCAHFHVRALPDPFGARRVFHQGFRDRLFEGVRPCAGQLYDYPSGVAVGDDSRKAVGFGIHEPHRVRRAVREIFGAPPYRRRRAVRDKRVVRRCVRIERQNAHRYARLRRIESGTEDRPVPVRDAHDFPGGGRAAAGFHRFGENPGMPADESELAPALQYDCFHESFRREAAR